MKSAEKLGVDEFVFELLGLTKDGNGRVDIGGRSIFVDSQGDDGEERSEDEDDGKGCLIHNLFLFSVDSFIFRSLQHLFLTPTDVLPGNKEANAPQ